MGAGMHAVDLHAKPIVCGPRTGLKGWAQLLVGDNRNKRFGGLAHVLTSRYFARIASRDSCNVHRRGTGRTASLPRLESLYQEIRAVATAPIRPTPSVCSSAARRSWSPRPGRL